MTISSGNRAILVRIARLPDFSCVGRKRCMSLSMILMLVQVFFAVIIGVYFWNLLRNQKSNRSAVDRESRKEMDKLRKLRSITLTKPLAEKTRPDRKST